MTCQKLNNSNTLHLPAFRQEIKPIDVTYKFPISESVIGQHFQMRTDCKCPSMLIIIT